MHWATTKEVVSALLELGCLIDARNFNGETALHLMVQRDRFDCVVTLLTHGADPNLVDNFGKSPLHLAAALGNLLLIQVHSISNHFHLKLPYLILIVGLHSFLKSLVTFDADVNLLNDDGESPRHIAAGKRNSSSAVNALHQVGSKRCGSKFPNCSDGCSPLGKDDGQSTNEEPIRRQRHFFDSMLESVCQHSATANQTKQ